MWISHAERPLNVNEICHALAIEIGSSDINTNNIPSIRTVLGCCQGLATVDKGSSTIRLIHFTLKEYLSRHADLFDRPHSKIAETLTYLNFQAIKDLSAIPSATILRYASLYWGTHMRMQSSERTRYLAPVFATVWGPGRPHGETAKKTGPDRTTIFTLSRPGTF